MTHPIQIHVVAIAGGSGTRFWPLSRKSNPKQLLPICHGRSLIHATFERIKSLVEPEQCWMVVGQDHVQGCRNDVPAIPAQQILAEPLGKNTAPAVALAAIQVQKKNPEAIVAILPADHYVEDKQAFCEALKNAAQIAQNDAIVTLGIQPTRPETGYGYIEPDKTKELNATGFQVKSFREKPDAALAQTFFESGDFYWNAGIFVFKPSTFMGELQTQLPKMHEQMMEIQSAIGETNYEAVLSRNYQNIENISIDYGIMENAKDVAVVPANCGWSDVGSWNSVDAIFERDQQSNLTHGRYITMDANNNVISSNETHVIGVIGLDNIAVVHTKDATLVVPRDRAQDVKQLLSEIEKNEWSEYL